MRILKDDFARDVGTASGTSVSPSQPTVLLLTSDSSLDPSFDLD